MQTKILIIGAGELGQTLATLLETNPNHNLTVWDRNKEKCSHGTELSQLLPTAEVVLYCAPSWALHELLATYTPSPDTLWFTFAKGIDPESHLFMDQVMQKELSSTVSWAIVGGPMLAEELESQKGGVAVIGTHYLECIRGFDHTFHHIPSIRIAASDDPHGVAVAGTLKNVYALFLGLIDGLEFGVNHKSYYTSYCLHEMLQLGALFGGRFPTILGPAGLSDLLATGSSTYSTNFRAGQAFARGNVPQKEGEGIHTLRQLIEMTKNQPLTFPLLQAVSDIFILHKHPQTALQELSDLS